MLENALLDAAWEELQVTGFAGLTMERVAERAGTSRAVIYRRWSNRGELAVAAMRHRQPDGPARLPDTGSLRGDVLALMRRAASRIADVGPGTVIGLLDQLGDDDGASAELLAQLTRGGSDAMAVVLDRARTRGEVVAEVSPRVARLPLDLLRHELFLNRARPSQATLEEIVDDVFLPLVTRPSDR